MLLGELRLKHWSKLLKSDLSEMKPTEQQIILRCLSRWAETEKAERKGQMIAIEDPRCQVQEGPDD